MGHLVPLVTPTGVARLLYSWIVTGARECDSVDLAGAQTSWRLEVGSSELVFFGPRNLRSGDAHWTDLIWDSNFACTSGCKIRDR
jgi:hypothetical protein